ACDFPNLSGKARKDWFHRTVHRSRLAPHRSPATAPDRPKGSTPLMSTSRIPIRRISAAALAGATALASVALGAAGAQADPAATVFGAEDANAIAGEYIVVMESEFSTMSSEYDAQIVDRFDSINGYLAEMSETEAAKVAADDQVAFVEQNRTVGIADVQHDPPSWG